MSHKKRKPIQKPIETPTEIKTEQIFSNKYIPYLIIITIIGFFLRFINLGYNSLWLDEASTVTFATAGSFMDIWNLTATLEPNPPLFHWIEYIMLMFGNNEFILRFIPALLGTTTIPIIYYIGKEIIDENGGLIAAIFFAVSPFLIVYSQEARAYSVLLFFIALSILFYFRALKDTTYKYWLLFGIAASLAFWTHYYTLLMIIALLVYTLAIYKFKYLYQMCASYGLIAITTLPLAVISLPVILKSKSGGPTFGVQGINVIIETLVQFTGYNIILTYILLAIFICGLIIFYLKDTKNFILILWILSFIFITSVILSFKIPMVPRYLIFLMIFIALGIAASYKLLVSLGVKTNAAIVVIISLILITSCPFLLNYYSGYSKDDWRGFASTLSGITQPGDSIIIVPGYISQPLNYYYSNKTDGTIEYFAYNASQLQQFRNLQTKNSYYIVTGDIQSANPEGDALQWLTANTKQFYNSNSIYVFKS